LRGPTRRWEDEAAGIETERKKEFKIEIVCYKTSATLLPENKFLLRFRTGPHGE